MADLPCPTCGSPLSFLEQYQRYYCHRCLQYAPEGYGEHGARTCASCGGILSYVRQYGRLYCYRCGTYAPEEPPVPMHPEGTAKSSSAPSGPSEATTPSTPAAASSTELASPPAPTETSLAPATPVPEAPAEAPPSQPSPEKEEPPSAEPVPDFEVHLEPPTAAEPAGAPAATTEESAPPSHEMRALASRKPAAVRVKLFVLKKAELVDLCRIYGLDPVGNKDQLQERLLNYLHGLEAEGEPEVGAPVEEPTAQPETQATPAPAVAATAAPETVVAEPAPAPTMAEPSVVAVEETPKPAAAASLEPAPVLAIPAPAAAEAPRAAPKVEHPCPTCARELTFISQYNRYYCYYCQRYAPATARAKNACPTCGATMRWIDQYRRWWCDDCQKYASADLPPPEGAAVIPTAATRSTPATARAIVVHHHGSPASGAGLVGLGIALYVVYAFFAYLGDMLGLAIPSGLTQDMLSLLQFFAFVLVAFGAIVGLYGLRDRT